MARSKSSRRRGRSSRSNTNQAPLPVMSLTPEFAFERQLAQSTDSTVFRGKAIFSFNLNTAPTNLLQIYPTNLGSRASVLATVYSRFRVKALLIKFTITGNSGAANTGAVGILDDNIGEGDTPTSLTGVMALRSSASFLNGQTEYSRIMYLPLDKKKWYYTNAGASGSDGRLVIPGTIFGASVGSSNCTVELDYTLVYAGADNIAST